VREIPTSEEILELLLPPGDGAAPSYDREALLNALERLTRKQVFVINALFWEGLSIREVAAELQVSRSRVVTLRNRALEALGRSLS
jgi:RNA polymerase sigma factor (sigma-70 family)